MAGSSPVGSVAVGGDQGGAQGSGVVSQLGQSDLDGRPVLGARQLIAQVAVDARPQRLADVDETDSSMPRSMARP